MDARAYLRRTQQAVGALAQILLGVSLFVLVFVEIPQQNKGEVGLVIGAIIAGSAQFNNWLFGSTKDAHETSHAIAQVAERAVDAVAASTPAAAAQVPGTTTTNTTSTITTTSADTPKPADA